MFAVGYIPPEPGRPYKRYMGYIGCMEKRNTDANVLKRSQEITRNYKSKTQDLPAIPERE